MKLYFSPASPYVRKVMAVAHEAGLADRIEKLPSAASPVKRDETIAPHNPTGKVPTLVTDDGLALYDSRVICEYLDSLHEGPKLYPAPGRARWEALVLHSAADGLLDAALLARYEMALRPEDLRWNDWIQGQMKKVASCVVEFETKWMATLEGDLTTGSLAVACALGYLDFRFPDAGWRTGNDRLAAWYETISQRPSMLATAPQG